MKKFLSILIIISTILGCCIVHASEVNVVTNGTTLNSDQGATIIDGRTLVPLRAIFEALGADVEWDSLTRSVEAKKRYSTISLQIGSKAIYINQIRNEIDVSAMLINDRTMVPARAVSEALGAKVGWDDATKTVYINSESSFIDIIDHYIKGEVKADDGTVVLKYFYAYPELKNDSAKTLEYLKEAELFTQNTLNDATINALADYETSTANGFLFFPHEIERRFNATSNETGSYTIEFKEETFDGTQRNTEIR